MNARLDLRNTGQSLKARILNALPAATYQMDRFLSLVDIVVSDMAPTACVESGPQPRMHVNPEFIAKHCRYDEQLLMLVLHELYHVILGHTQLFPRPTEAHNIAFDAFINALLCHQFKDNLISLDFFRSINGSKNFPARLLRPPVGWPGRTRPVKGQSPEEIRIIRGLYGEKPNNITYQEVLDLLKANTTKGKLAEIVLLGDHSGEGKGGEKDDRVAKSEIVKKVLREVVKDWPKKARAQLDGVVGKDRGEGGRIDDFLMPKAKTPRREFLDALAKLLVRAGALNRYSQASRRWKKTVDSEDMTSVFPDIRDRLAHGREALWGRPPILFTTSINRFHWRLTPKEAVHVYLDISGSMANELPWLAGALDPLEQSGSIKLFAFSTVVSKVARGGLLRDSVRNTGGTDINCIFEHIWGYPKRLKPARIVIITDGYFGSLHKGYAKRISVQELQVNIGLTEQSTELYAQNISKSITRLPNFCER